MRLKPFVLGVLPALAALATWGAPSRAQVKINEGNGVNIKMENEALKLNIAVEGGGRISSLVNKKTGKEMVTLWKGPTEDGGLLDDRNVFTSFMYRAAVMQPGGKVGTVRLSAKHPGGMEMTKILTLREGGSTLEVQETFANGTQKDARFMLRSFLLPGGGPLSADYQYFIPQKEKPLEPVARANNYFENLSSPWSALWNKASGEGVLVAAPGVEKFYFWQGSEIFPTYEWVYPNVPAGKALSVNYAIQLVNAAAPDWSQLSAAALKGLPAARFSDVAGWQNEEQRFQVSDAERARGFWLSTGGGEGKRRAPQTLQLDVPQGEARSVYLALNALQEVENGDLQIRFKNLPAGLVQSGWETNGKDFIKVLPFDSSTKISLKNGTEGRLWLTLHGGEKPVAANGEIEIALNNQKIVLPLQAKVWPVQVPALQPFDVRAYSGVTVFFGGYQLSPESVQQANTLFKAFHAMGGNMMSWTLNWNMWHRLLKIQGIDQTAAEWLKANRTAFAEKPATQWPALDFSAFDPYVQAAKINGVNLAGAYLPLSTPEKPVTAQDEWILIELKKYLQANGFRGFYCKIADEISPEHLPAYIESAKVARRAGWRPGTTITGGIARTASLINEINPYCDVWEVGFGSTEFFKNLTSQRYTLEEKTVVLPADGWGGYDNGGARDTIAQKLFGALIPLRRAEVERLQVFQNGQPLQGVGGSPWGNQKRGVFFGDSDYLYLSPREGVDAKQVKTEVRYQVRVPSDKGQTLAAVDKDDQIWFYGGLSNSYRATYESSARYPLKALEGGYDGYGWYDFHRWNADKVVWYNKETDTFDFGPAYLGLRDGWNDACLMAWLAQTKKIPVSRFLSENAAAPLRMGEEAAEVYRWKNVVNLTDPFVLNDARRKVLMAAEK
jgi:hypothetical protein